MVKTYFPKNPYWNERYSAQHKDACPVTGINGPSAVDLVHAIPFAIAGYAATSERSSVIIASAAG